MTVERVYQVFFFLLPIIGLFQASSESGVPLENQLTPKLNVSIYYEGLCPDSRMFITQVFYPQFKLFADYLNVRFIPFGKASIQDDGTEYECQHGKEECIRNIIHGCALDILSPGEQQVEFVVCAMINKSLQGQKECTEKRGLNWDDVDNCRNGTRGLALTLTAQYDTRVSTGGPKFVPTIIFNNKFSQDEQNIAFQDPAAVICNYLPGIPPCNGLRIK